jgi:type II restriction enzyme
MPHSISNFIPLEGYISETQKIRVASEGWFVVCGYCTECLDDLEKFPNNSPVADFFCNKCKEQYELKSKQGKFGKKITDGEYNTMIKRINSNENPNLFAMTYEKGSYNIKDIIAIPKYFFTEKVIEKRKPLSDKAKRAGWTGCNILFSEIPEIGKIFVMRDGDFIERNIVNKNWDFAKSFEIKSLKQRGWTFEILKIVEKQKETFILDDIYKYEEDLQKQFPDNNHIKDKIRQQLQILRDKKYIDFVSKGLYKKFQRN